MLLLQQQKQHRETSRLHGKRHAWIPAKEGGLEISAERGRQDSAFLLSKKFELSNVLQRAHDFVTSRCGSSDVLLLQQSVLAGHQQQQHHTKNKNSQDKGSSWFPFWTMFRRNSAHNSFPQALSTKYSNGNSSTTTRLIHNRYNPKQVYFISHGPEYGNHDSEC
ncbi:hypothetical protein ACA910_001610 [Epithemia clementina (nom. ined.)]